MDYNKIKDLINTIDKSSFIDFELELYKDLHIKMSKSKINKNKELTNENKKDKEDIAAENVLEPITIIPEDKVEVKEGNIISSPIVGTFYESSAPDKPPFVNVGDKVKKGDVLCIIEAMKIMNEITSKYDGEVVEILVKNEDMVEYNQPLFRIV